jgi:hypothetical protein
MAQWARFAVILVTLALAGFTFMEAPAPSAFPAMIGVFCAGAVLAQAVFRRLATPEEVRADLEDRMKSD